LQAVEKKYRVEAGSGTKGNVKQVGSAAKLAATAIVGQSVAYLLAIVLARRLGVEGFEAYAVASAVFTFMVMFAPRGIEKYALRLLPALFERSDWSHAGGFLRFGLRHILFSSLLVATAVGTLVLWFSDISRATKLAIFVSCLSLPAGALVHYGVEVLSARGRVVMATVIFRLAVPTMTFLLVVLLLLSPFDVSGAMAVACWGAAWVLALVAMVVSMRRVLPPGIWRTPHTEQTSTWLAEARPFWYYRISLALVAQAAIIALDGLQPSATAVGAYVAAIATANLPLVLVTSTHRHYARRLSILLERRDFAGVLDLRRERLQWLVPLLILFLAAVFGLGREILGVFRPEFVDEGFAALQVLAIATATSMLFALAPTYLKYAGHSRATLATVGGAAVVQVILLIMLVPGFAALGAAIAFSVSILGMYLAFAWMAYRELVQLRKSDGRTSDP